MPTTPQASGSRGAAAGASSLPSDRDFIRALRDHAMSSGGDFGSRVIGLTHPPELEQWSGLSRPSVTALVERFEAVLDPQDSNGEPVPPAQARRWALNPKAGIVVAVQIGQVSRMGVSDIYGRLAPDNPDDPARLDLFDPEEQEEAVAIADKTLDWAVKTIKRLVGGASADEVIAVCISFAAPIDRDRGLLRAPFSAWRRDAAGASLEEWQLMKARDQLTSRLGWEDVVFLLDNDANLGALAEYVWGAGRWAASHRSLSNRPPYQDMLYVEWSRGIGSGLILDGGLYRGRGVAGELGHTVIAPDGNEICPACGKAGCLESVAGWNAVFKDALGEDPDGISRSDLIAMLQPGHKRYDDVAGAFERAAKQMARVVGPAIHLLNPQLVVIGGDVGSLAYDLVRAPLHQALNDFTMHPALADVTVVQTKLGEDRALRGGIALALLQQKDDPETLLNFLQHKRDAEALLPRSP